MPEDTPTPITDYISTKEASERAHLTQDHIIRLLHRGAIQGIRKAREWLVYAPSLAAYIASKPKRGLKPGTKLGPRRKTKPAEASNAQTL
ncbi:MAG: helix-turn-helix domain-containing protein [Chloroflexi bacterium]|nr:helix-turn-helix domain-containing protein [Chloroflexota bacterium]